MFSNEIAAESKMELVLIVVASKDEHSFPNFVVVLHQRLRLLALRFFLADLGRFLKQNRFQ